MIEIGPLDVRGGAGGNRADVSGESFRIALVKPLVAFAQGFPDRTSQGLASLLSDSLSEAVGLGILDIQASTFLYQFPPFYILADSRSRKTAPPEGASALAGEIAAMVRKRQHFSCRRVIAHPYDSSMEAVLVREC